MGEVVSKAFRSSSTSVIHVYVEKRGGSTAGVQIAKNGEDFVEYWKGAVSGNFRQGLVHGLSGAAFMPRPVYYDPIDLRHDIEDVIKDIQRNTRGLPYDPAYDRIIGELERMARKYT